MNCGRANSVLQYMKMLLVLLALAPFLVVADTVYKSVDEQGNVVFSDQPSANAEKTEVQVAPAIDFEQVTLPRDTTRKTDAGPAYEQVIILEPANKQTIRDNPGNLNVLLQTEPALKPGHSVGLYMDGKQVNLGTDALVQLDTIDRGEHVLVARILDADNKVILASKPVTFYMHRISKLTSPLNRDSGNGADAVSPTNPPRVRTEGVTPVNPPRPGSQPAAPASVQGP